ncbi:MAG: Ig-like domain-containing protein [Candidatus Heimdallarchaeota archaeon]|nr:MAG: Ig-like domain-containing protein [Candidatus Heimdallarchaeota archaeon]
MNFPRLKKRRRGQIRAVDFVVSLFLFLLMLSQLILLVINVQTGINTSSREIITYEELDILGRQLLFEDGDLDWGYHQSLPASFGLADSNAQSYLVLDSAKIARLTFKDSSGVSGYTMFDYDTLKETIGLDRDFNFRLGFYPLLNAEVNASSTNFAQVNVKNLYNISIADALVNFFTIDLTNGNVIPEGATLTNSNGETSLQLSNPTENVPGGEHIVFIIVEKGPLWCMNWSFNDPTSEVVFIGPSSSTTIWGGGINSTSFLASDNLPISPDSHFLSIIYQNTTSGYSKKTINLETASYGNETVSIPNEGLVAFLSIAITDNQYQVKIGSYPVILDRVSTGGIFNQVFGEEIPGTRTKSMLSKFYPIIVRGTLMSCQLTLWSK